ncbi:hypothetical protein OQA88_9334 [Cercophora sp. LCS_1]
MSGSIPPILRLPDEVLQPILLDAAGIEVDNPLSGPSGSPARVCRRFNRVVTPHLYRHITIEACEHRTLPGSATKRRKLHETLRNKPSLRQHCEQLSVLLLQTSIEQRLDPDLTDDPIVLSCLVGDFVIWLENVSHFRVVMGEFSSFPPFQIGDPVGQNGTGEDGPAWYLFDMALSRRSYEKVTLDGMSDGELRMPSLVRRLHAIAGTKSLAINGVRPTSRPNLVDPWINGSSAITTLVIESYDESEAKLNELLSFPAALQHFTLFRKNETLDPNELPSKAPWQLSSIVGALRHHELTLKTLSVHDPNCLMRFGVDLSRFTALRQLSLSGNITTIPKNHGESLNIFPPQLQSLTLILDQLQPVRTIPWIRDFVPQVLKQNMPLRHLRLDFIPQPIEESHEDQQGESYSDGVGRIFGPDPDDWPWDTLDALAAELRAVGVSLVYPGPAMSKGALREWMLQFGPRDYTQEWSNKWLTFGLWWGQRVDLEAV